MSLISTFLCRLEVYLLCKYFPPVFRWSIFPKRGTITTDGALAEQQSFMAEEAHVCRSFWSTVSAQLPFSLASEVEVAQGAVKAPGSIFFNRDPALRVLCFSYY